MTYHAARQLNLFGDPAAERPSEKRVLIDEETGLRLNDPDRCAICGKEHGLHRHHVFFGTSNRALSEEDGMVVYLCPECHEHGPNAVHRNREADVAIKAAAQRVWMDEHDADEDAFIARYGRSWLWTTLRPISCWPCTGST